MFHVFSVAMVWEGLDVIAASRKIMGATKPQDSAVGTIRGDYAVHMGRNIIHGSDGVASAKREIEHWFKENEVFDVCILIADIMYQSLNSTSVSFIVRNHVC
jgi:nucleoside-diphosphate kinase